MYDEYPEVIQTVMACLKKLPGVGARSAERFAFHMLDWESEDLQLFSHTLKTFKESVKHCATCGCILNETTCGFCDNSSRDSSILCVVSSAKDVYAMEKTHSFKGLYHVLGGLLNPLEGINALNLDLFFQRLEQENTQEVVLALDSTLEGDATSLFLKQKLSGHNIQISRLAYGIPMGSPLEFVDGTTLSRAFSGRQRA